MSCNILVHVYKAGLRKLLKFDPKIDARGVGSVVKLYFY